METMRPLQYLNNFAKELPGVFKAHEEIRMAARQNLEWPHWCYLPMAATLEVLKQYRFDPRLIAPVAALAAWRVGKIVIRFHPEVQAALKQSASPQIPSDTLLLLPVWGVYVEYTHQGVDPAAGAIHGFFAHLEYDYKHKTSELRILLDGENGLTPLIVMLDNTNLSDSWEALSKNNPLALQSFKEAAKVYNPLLQDIISMLLYLCAENDTSSPLQNPSPQKRKGREVLHAASGPKIVLSGWKTGQRLQEAKAGTGGVSVTPHLRKAHWHTYRIGKGRQHTTLKWLHPILVGEGSGASESTNVYVKKAMPKDND